MRRIAVVLLLLISGCATNPAVGSLTKVRPEAQRDCASNCAKAGMRLGAVVLIMNSEGCVCEPMNASADAQPNSLRPSTGAGAVVSGVLAAEEEQRREEQQNHASRAHRPAAPARPSR